MRNKQRIGGWRVVPAFVLIAALYGAGSRAGETVPGNVPEDVEAEVGQLVEKIAEIRAARDQVAMDELLEEFVEVHNRIESKSLRHDLQHVAAKVLKDKKMGAARESAARALGRLNDADGAYKHLKRLLPSRKAETATALEMVVLGAVGELHADRAITPLLGLMTKAKDAEVAAGAIEALGGYGASKRRAAILEEMVSTMKRIRPYFTPGKRTGQATRERWRAVGPPLVRALNGLTGQQVRGASDWIDLYETHKKRPKTLFVDRP